MRGWDWMGRRPAAVVAVAACAFAALPAGAGAKVTFKRLSTVNASSAAAVAMARTANGTLHLVFQTFAGRAFSGLATMSISTSGAPGPQIPALSSWATTQPGLVASPTGGLTAFFGAANPSLFSTVWGMSSMNGGSTWGAPFDVRGTGPNEALADAADVTAVMSGATPVLALPHAGNLVIQVGLGPTAANYQLTTPANASMTDADLAVDAATHQVVAGWRSLNGAGGDWLQGAAPISAAQPVPGQPRNALIPSGRDKGAGVYAAYTSDGSHVRLLRYGGGSVAVGAVPGLAAKALGTATGPDGRIWVFWGTDSPSGIAVTRSNRAVTRFEPLQRVNSNAFTLYRLSGDGRLGPLDLFADEIPNANTVVPAGNYYARVLPLLSASVKVKAIKNGTGKVIAHTVTVTVTDAGDAVPGATVAIAGKKAKTNASGVATVTVPGGSSGKATLTVTHAGYQPLTLTVKL
ncbi:MAG TPA: hypothetical protein VF781_04225 [Solirubrobacteraceae bacterium]